MPADALRARANFSGIFAPLYRCPMHGETWHVQRVEEIDCENDEVYVFMACSRCYATCEPVMKDGLPVLHPLTDDEVRHDA